MVMEPNWKSIVETGWTFANDGPRLIEYFTGIDKQYPSSARAKFEMANALDYLDREAEAIPLYEEAIRMGLPTEYHAYALLQLGSSLRNVGRVNEAVEILAQAEKSFPQFSTISMFLGLTLYSEGKYVEALKTVITAMLKHVHSADVQRYAKGIENYIKDIK
ncbi:MAG: tetratricopeptide repeat protein [Bacillota bacterium]